MQRAGEAANGAGSPSGRQSDPDSRPDRFMRRFFRIRHGECDRDTSLVISAMLTAKLREAGCEVDYHSPWNTPHAGDYDLDELFAWIDGICG